MKKNEILLLLISTFILTVIWITLSVYHNSVTSTIPETQSTYISPIKPDFDTKVIEELKKRRKVVPFSEIEISPSPASTSTATPTPIIIPSISPTSTPSATPNLTVP